MQITNFKKTGYGCPMVWEFELDGKPAYLRYRWGVMSLKLESGNGLWNDVLFSEQIGDDMDGFCDEDVAIDFLQRNGCSIQ